MTGSIRKCVSLLMLLVLLTNVCVWDSSGVRLAHQIVHVEQIDQGANNHAHSGLATGVKLGKASVLHQVLHAVDHLQYAAGVPSLPGLHLPGPGAAPVPAPESAPTLAALEPPYRPPSGAAGLA